MANISFNSPDSEQHFYLAKPIMKCMEGKNFNNRWIAFKAEIEGHLRIVLACAETVDVDLVEYAIGLEGVMVEMTKPGNWNSLKVCSKKEWTELTRFEAEQRMQAGAPAPEPPITKVQPTLDATRDFRIHRVEVNVEEVNKVAWKGRMELVQLRSWVEMCMTALNIKPDSAKDHDPKGFTEEPFEDEDDDDDDQLDWLGQKLDLDW